MYQSRIVVCCLTLAVVGARPAAAQSVATSHAHAAPAARVTRVSADAITIDGRLDEAIWASAGDFGQLKQLRAARTFDFDPLGATADASDFNFRSLRGNAVLRWEYRPGSTLYLVWQQFRSGEEDFGRFRFGRDLRGVFEAQPENVVAIKATYWLAL